jgi:pseudaminic acid cytidylyltransferase
MKRIAIIFARGGSKRIPDKNIKIFCGKPMISHIIGTIKKSKIFDDIYVSTDDQIIADISCFEGAAVPFLRSRETSNDYATLHSAVCEFLLRLPQVQQYESIGVFLATAPLLTGKTILSVISRLETGNYDSCLTGVMFEKSFDASFEISSEGVLHRSVGSVTSSRTQEQKFLYHDAGQMYAIRSLDIHKRSKIVGERCWVEVIDRLNYQDIDTLEDWEIAEAKYRYLNNVI